MYKFSNYKFWTYIYTELGNPIHQPEILPETWQNWMYCMYPRSSYTTDFLPASAPYNSLLHAPAAPTPLTLPYMLLYICTVHELCSQTVGEYRLRPPRPNATSNVYCTYSMSVSCPCFEFFMLTSTDNFQDKTIKLTLENLFLGDNAIFLFWRSILPWSCHVNWKKHCDLLLSTATQWRKVNQVTAMQ
jgi:hypothetical protein